MVRRGSTFLALLVVACLIPLLSPRAQQPIGPAPVGIRPPTAPSVPSGSPNEIEELREEIRKLKSQLKNQSYALFNYLIFAPEMETQSEDYALARSRFQTKLGRRGPSPQPWFPMKPPDGVSEIEYVSGELRLKAWVNRMPDATTKHPAVLFLHGGHAFGVADWEQTKPYRDAGFVVLVPMLRGENGLPGAFSYYYDEVDDVLAASEFLRKLPFVDPGCVFLAGHSVGGTMTLLAALASSQFRAAASFDGSPYWGPFTEDRNLPFDKSDSREIMMRSPMVFAGSFKCPLRIYLHQMESDPLGDLYLLMSQRTVALAQRRGLDVELAEVEGNHMTHVPRAIMQSIAFFERIAGQENSIARGAPAPLPKDYELDLGGNIKMKLVRLEAGRFRMGSPAGEAGRRDDEVQRETNIAKPLLMGAYLVTQAQFRQVTGSSPSQFSAHGNYKDFVAGLNTDEFPVENVSWEDAMDFCRIVSLLPAVRENGWIVDLPTEAEWEYSCRAGMETAFTFGDDPGKLVDYGWFESNSQGRVHRAGEKQPNPWGLFDMHGNVFQWTKDSYDAGTASGRVARGGLFLYPAKECRCARRFHFGEKLRTSATVGAPPMGFRVAVRQRGN